jgi:hypothetical protein
MQRWALLLAGYTYDIVYRASKDHANADALSRLPLKIDQKEDPDEATSINMLYIENLPITASDIKEATRKDVTLGQVLDHILNGWPGHTKNPAVVPYFTRRTELTVEEGCVLWGNRVVVPDRFHEQLLDELHSVHPGMCHMKAIARSYIWWPGIDSDIEEVVRSCEECIKVSNSPSLAPLIHWKWCTKPWERIHIDYAQKGGQDFLILVDSHSKWLEVEHMKSTTSQATIRILRKLFASYGFPNELVSDNGPQFTSDEFKLFLKNNGVKQTLVPPYHPATNGLAERYVQTFKKMLEKTSKHLPLSHRIASVLFMNRNTPHTLTGRTPAELFLGRAPRTRWTNLKPHLQTTVEDRQQKQKIQHDGNHVVQRTFDLFQKVRVKNARGGKEKWIPATIVKVEGPLTYIVRLPGNRRRFVHVDHLIPDDTGEDMREDISIGAPIATVPEVTPGNPIVVPSSQQCDPEMNSPEQSMEIPQLQETANQSMAPGSSDKPIISRDSPRVRVSSRSTKGIAKERLNL